MAILGLRDTSNFVANQRPENWRQGILMMYPNGTVVQKAPLTALTALMKTRVVDDSTFHWWEKELDDRAFELHATTGNLDNSPAGTVQDITLAAGSNGKTLKRNDILYVMQTGERLQIASDPASDTTLTVVRGFQGTVPQTLDPDGANINPFLVCIGSAFEEASMSPTGVSFDPVEQYNYTQIFRSALEISRTAEKTRLRTGPAVQEAKRECLEYISVDMERAWFFGKRSVSTQNNRPIRTANGILEQVPSDNIYAFTSAQVTLAKLNEKMQDVFRFGSNEKLAFMGNRAIGAIQEAVRLGTNSSYQIFPNEKEYGMKVMRLVSPFGELVIKGHPLMTQMTSALNGGASQFYNMDTWAFILDMANVNYVYLKDSDLDYYPDVQAKGMDGMKSEYLAECSLELHHAKTHHVWKNMFTGAAG